MDNIRAAMIIDRGMSPLEEEVRRMAARTVIRMCRDHETILRALGLVEEPERESAGGAEREAVGGDGTCKRGHPKTPENQRRHKNGWRCRACERYTEAERRKRTAAPPKKTMYTSSRPVTRTTPSDIARNNAIKEARTLLGLSWRGYKALYGSKASTALAVIAAADDPAALDALKRDDL
jgi:hypothetical protein